MWQPSTTAAAGATMLTAHTAALAVQAGPAAHQLQQHIPMKLHLLLQQLPALSVLQGPVWAMISCTALMLPAGRPLLLSPTEG